MSRLVGRKPALLHVHFIHSSLSSPPTHSFTHPPPPFPNNSETDKNDGKDARLFGYVGMPKVETRIRKAQFGQPEKWTTFKVGG